MSGDLPATPTVHIVASPTTRTLVPADPGRVAPLVLLAHALRAGLCNPGPVIVVGASGAEETASSLGLTPAARVCLPLGVPRLGRRALARLLRGVERVICWSDELTPLVRGMADEVRLVSTDPDACPATPRQLAQITTLTEHDAQRWRLRGGTPETHDDWIEQIREHPSDTPPSGLRAAHSISDSTLVVTTFADRPAATDARSLAFLLSVLHTTGYAVCGVVPSVAHNTHAARRHIRGLVSRYPLLVTERPIHTLLDGIDVVILPKEDDSAASLILEAFAGANGCRVIRLSPKGRAGLKSTPGAVAPILETLDALLAARAGTQPVHEPAHA